MIMLYHITYRYIDPSRHNFENCLPPQFVSQSCLGWPLAAWAAKGDNFQNNCSTIQYIYIPPICNVTLSKP